MDISGKTDENWQIVNDAWQVVLESNPAAADAVRQMLDQIRDLRAEVERLRKIERAARAAVETEKALGYVSLTLLSDVLDET